MISQPLRPTPREEWTGAAHPDATRVSITGMPQRRPPVLHELVVQAARRTPDAIALISGAHTLRYGELLDASERLAQRLLDSGVQLEQPVGVHLPRGIDYVIALLGILRAGATFVPIDTGWPEHRRAEVSTRAGVALVVGSGARPGGLPSATATIDLHEDCEPGRHRLPEVDPEQIAYVMFTSGSTGVPKGVMIRHGAIGYRLQWQRRLLGLDAHDGVLFKAPMGFDISINEIFLPLSVGARLSVAAPDHEADIAHLLDVIDRDGVTFFYVVASMLDLLLDRPDAAHRARSLRHIWCGGEALTDDLYRRFVQNFPDTVMMHGYGPAEATIGVSCRRYAPARSSAQGWGGITIGHPNPGARMYVLDRRLRPAPIGVVGELYIGGLPLGRGYVGAPARTAESFVADPVSRLPGSRLYRTGDMAIVNAEGQLVFRGRADHQVKVHGYRVELGELEAVTVRHPDIRHAAVIVDNDGELAAFCRPCPRAVLTATALRQWLQQMVPHHMVPRRIIFVKKIPLTVSGKIDRTALADYPVTTSTDTDGARAVPESATETALAEIWRDVLGVEAVDIERNFFELGGNSVSLTRVQNLIAGTLGIEVTLLELFEYTTVAGLAAHLDGQYGNAAGPGRDAGTDGTVGSARSHADAARVARRRAAARHRGAR